jgi:tetratricopeptide (TPR) repeat protein
MDSHLPLQPDGHRGHNHAASEKECLPPIFSQALFEALPSDSFEHEFDRQMNDLPKGDYRRARALFITGGHFNLLYCRSGSLASLDHAIRCLEQAVEELCKSHEEFKIYVTLHTDLLQERAEKSLKPEDVGRYISGLQLCIRYLEECRLKEGKKRQLGCAYSLRAALTQNIEDINLAIETLEGRFETPEKIYPKAALCLGAALYQRYEQEPQLDYLDRSVELLRKGLGAITSDMPLDARQRDAVMECIASACAIVNGTPCGDDMRSRLINNLEMVLSSTPPGGKVISRVEKRRLQLIMTQCFKEPDSIKELRDTVLAGVVGEVTETQSPWSPIQLPPNVTTVFINEPLSDKKNIRLVVLLPGTRKDFVQCEIFEEAMDNLPHYEVLRTDDAEQTVTFADTVSGTFLRLGRPKGDWKDMCKWRHPRGDEESILGTSPSSSPCDGEDLVG